MSFHILRLDNIYVEQIKMNFYRRLLAWKTDMVGMIIKWFVEAIIFFLSYYYYMLIIHLF